MDFSDEIEVNITGTNGWAATELKKKVHYQRRDMMDGWAHLLGISLTLQREVVMMKRAIYNGHASATCHTNE
jgi:hypothetical protein